MNRGSREPGSVQKRAWFTESKRRVFKGKHDQYINEPGFGVRGSGFGEDFQQPNPQHIARKRVFINGLLRIISSSIIKHIRKT